MDVLEDALEVRDVCVGPARKVDVRLPGKGDSDSHGARPVHLIITKIKWIRTSRLSIQNSLSLGPARQDSLDWYLLFFFITLKPRLE